MTGCLGNCGIANDVLIGVSLLSSRSSAPTTAPAQSNPTLQKRPFVRIVGPSLPPKLLTHRLPSLSPHHCPQPCWCHHPRNSDGGPQHSNFIVISFHCYFNRIIVCFTPPPNYIFFSEKNNPKNHQRNFNGRHEHSNFIVVSIVLLSG